MLSKYLSAIDGIASYPIISLFIFVPFFIGMTIWVFKLDKQFLNYMGDLPLDDSTESLEDRK
ncbi:MAG: cbb3-type cytochrome c oxidase subunit 3 [Bacteroidetes bacterium]|nr:cbb3-type cytochrome c oxidase subunit 3 [Bacteroidota bacterium]